MHPAIYLNSNNTYVVSLLFFSFQVAVNAYFSD